MEITCPSQRQTSLSKKWSCESSPGCCFKMIGGDLAICCIWSEICAGSNAGIEVFGLVTMPTIGARQDPADLSVDKPTREHFPRLYIKTHFLLLKPYLMYYKTWTRTLEQCTLSKQPPPASCVLPNLTINNWQAWQLTWRNGDCPAWHRISVTVNRSASVYKPVTTWIISFINIQRQS